ncbi:30S ribosomal protein S14 [Micromonospora coxensis]|uniref:30S ribosomal protein S14 n=1 Tax=Micromonospora coxensis TaxID=356852 RepID=A0A1C5JV65_9ACTN|nr:30S ribosomal protein S14 [Micromonospora coxensis]SCG74480.1 SSU ribosomal protein S14P [Micromonospora coxensis]
MVRRVRRGRQARRVRLADRYAECRRAVRHPDPAVRDEAVRRLARLPRDAGPVRLRRRDQVDGRPRDVLRRFGLSRVRMRELALRGELPGVRRASR